MAEADPGGRGVVGFAHQCGDGRPDLDAHRVALRREDARVRRAVGGDLAGLVLVAVQAVDADGVERLQVTLSHAGERQAVEPRIVGDEADHAAARLLGDAPLGHAEEADVQVVQALALRTPDAAGRAVRLGQLPLLVHRHAREAVVGRVAEDDQDRPLLLHPLGAVALLLQLGERQRLGRARLPTGQRVGEEDAGALGAVRGERGIERLQGQADLEMRDDERRRHDLEAEHPFGRRLLHPRAGQRAQAAPVEVGGDAPEHLGEIGAGAAAGVEDVDVVGGQAVGDAQVVAQRAVDAGDHVADDLGGGVPDAELLAQVRVERFEEGLVEVGYGLALAEAGEERRPVHPVERRRRPVEHLDEAERLQPPGVGELLEQRPQHRSAQVPDRFAPVEAFSGGAGRGT